MKPLEGLFVVALEQAVAAPFTTCRLADAGARVVKLERAEGDFARGYDRYAKGEASYFVWLNRGKESVRVDLKTADDLALVRRMIARADVFIQNLAPGATGRLGLGADDLRRDHPRLIVCDISGYGSTGELKDMKAYDLLVQAESGLCGITGGPEGPARVGVSVCDIATGMNAYAAILECLLSRERTGEGAHIEVSLFHSMADWMNVPYLAHRYGNAAPKRVGLAHPSIAPYGLFICADGEGVVISVQNEREWQRLAANVLKRPELAADPRFASNAERVAHRGEVDAAIQDVLSTLPRAEVVRRLLAEKIAFGRVSTLADLAAHPQNRYLTVRTSGGEIEMLAPPAVINRTAPEAGPVPALGEHDAALRAEFSDDAQIDKNRE